MNRGISICQSYDPIADVKQMTWIFMNIYHQRWHIIFKKDFTVTGQVSLLPQTAVIHTLSTFQQKNL